ncbi:MAG TPA: hypothetical protein VFW96_23475 [Thermomicrobiales bacterium]|nr:hypothetical protein [Thermomicrobiales bacterium]
MRARCDSWGERATAPATAALLLVVLLAGLGVMTFTQSWLDAVHHDHLGPALPGAHHAHGHDDLARAFAYWSSVSAPFSLTEPSAADAAGSVISLSGANAAYSELSNFAMTSTLAVLLGLLVLRATARLAKAHVARPTGRHAAPPIPPPRRAGEA